MLDCTCCRSIGPITGRIVACPKLATLLVGSGRLAAVPPSSLVACHLLVGWPCLVVLLQFLVVAVQNTCCPVPSSPQFGLFRRFSMTLAGPSLSKTCCLLVQNLLLCWSGGLVWSSCCSSVGSVAPSGLRLPSYCLILVLATYC